MRIKTSFCLIDNFVLQKPFGNIINDVGHNSNGQLELFDLGKLEKLRIRLRKTEQHIGYTCCHYNINFTSQGNFRK